MTVLGSSREEGYSDEWYTPIDVLNAAREALGGPIDLDPASSAEANRTVQAARYFSLADDGLARPWISPRVWQNPPYSRSGAFLTKLIRHHDAGDVIAAVVLIPASTDVDWFADLWPFPICLRKGRTQFRQSGRRGSSQNNHGSAFAYLGPDPAAFRRAFCRFGPIVRRTENFDTWSWCRECRRTWTGVHHAHALGGGDFGRDVECCPHCGALR